MASINVFLAFFNSIRYELLLLPITLYAWTSWTSYRKLRQFNGPTLAKISNLFMYNLISTKKANLQLYDVSEKYGTISSLKKLLSI